MIISVAVHAAVVVVSSTANRIALPSSLTSAISVNLEEIKHITEKPVQPRPVVKKTTKTVAKKQVQPEQEKKVIAKEKTKDDEAEKKRQRNKAIANVKSDLIKKFDTNFIYPKLAKRRNWQGKVILSLHISPVGKIENIHLITSSGYDVLDNAAMTSLRKVGKLHDISLWFSNSINLHLPVIYKLTKS